MKKAIQFGAGNIGRGFIGWTIKQSRISCSIRRRKSGNQLIRSTKIRNIQFCKRRRKQRDRDHRYQRSKFNKT